MAITTEEKTAILETVSALFNKSFTAETTDKFIAFYEANENSLAKLADGLIGSPAYEALYTDAEVQADYATTLMAKYGLTYNGTSEADVAMTNFVNYSFENSIDDNLLRTIQAVDKHIVANVLPTVEDDNVFATMKAAVENKATATKNFIEDTANAGKELDLTAVTEDETTVDAGVVVTPVEPTEPEDEGVPGETYTLTTDERDILTGTENDDIFDATVAQNQNGNIANAFATGDKLDGGLGNDKLVATVQADYTIGSGTNGTDNSTVIRANTKNIQETYFEAIDDVTIQATRMENVEQYWSDFSDANLEITDINLNGSNLSITKDVTFGMKDTAHKAGLKATFDSQSLRKLDSNPKDSALSIEIADVSTETPTTPLANVNMNLGFTLGGVDYVLENLQADGGTYAGLITAIQTALAAEGLGSLTVTGEKTYTDVTVANNNVNLPFTATEIQIEDPAGQIFENVTFKQNAIEPVADGFLVAGTAVPVSPTEESTMIETNLILDNAGRGSMGGDVEIGGQSTSKIGIEKFNVTVNRDSKINSLKQSHHNNDALTHIDIVSTGVNGDLTIGGIDADLSSVNATGFVGENLSIGETIAVSDLTSFNSAGTSTNVTLDADYDGSGRASNAQEFTINTGTGDDTITAKLTGESTSGSTTASLTVNSEGGDNTITLSSNDTEVNKANVTTGNGSDTVTGGATHLTVDTNAGNDVIYAENTGDKAVAELAASVYGATIAETKLSTLTKSQFLNGKKITVTVAMPEGNTAGTDEVDSFVNGYEIKFDFKSAKELSTEVEFYNAVADQINADEVVNKLVKASVDSNGDLAITYLVDGLTVDDEEMVQIEVSDADITAANVSNAFLKAVQEAVSDSSVTKANVAAAYNENVNDGLAVATTNGSNSTTDGVNVVNGGADNDVIVLSSNDATSDTVVFDAGQFGNDTIVHFNVGANGDKLDFSDWLNNKTSASKSTESQVHVNNVLNADTVIQAGEVTVTDFTTLSVGGGATFANMTNAQVEAAIETAYTTAVTSNLVGTTQNSIFMIENNANQGEYKVYQVTSDNAAGNNFTGATLVGSVDFGETLDGVIDTTNIATGL